MQACKAALSTALTTGVLASTVTWAAAGQTALDVSAGLESAQDAFYNARYEEAATRALELRAVAPDDLAGYELRTSALLFQLKRLIGNDKNKRQRLQACAVCPELIAAFRRDTAAAQALARARLRADPSDEAALFFLGKVDLNYVWLHLGPFGRKTGWSEYREAKRSLETLLARNPHHVRARAARAWIDYIVDTRMPMGTKWMFGGGSRTRGLAAMRAAAEADADFYARTEARFGLWEMLVLERDLTGATAVARELAQDFPANPVLEKFVEASQPVAGPLQ